MALLVYHDFDRFEAAKRMLRFAQDVVKYGAATGPNTPPNYGAARYVRIGGDTPASSSVYSPMQDAIIWGAFDGNNPCGRRNLRPGVRTDLCDVETAGWRRGCAIRLGRTRNL